MIDLQQFECLQNPLSSCGDILTPVFKLIYSVASRVLPFWGISYCCPISLKSSTITTNLTIKSH